MKDKYYQPTKEEFYIGFEYEMQHVKSEEWIKETVRDYKDIRYVELLPNKRRVKYLDKEDIEDLGFKQITDNCYNLPIGNEEFRLLFEDNILKIYLADKYSNMLFQGNVKNKSALKILLKQLNIK